VPTTVNESQVHGTQDNLYCSVWTTNSETSTEQVVMRTANLALHPTAGCCHL